MRMIKLALMFLTLSLLVRAQEGVAGQWLFILDTEGGERRAEATFQVEGSQVSGKWDKTDVKGTFENGTLKLDFPMHSEEGGISANLKINGTLKGGELAGTWEFGGYNGTYRATRKPS